MKKIIGLLILFSLSSFISADSIKSISWDTLAQLNYTTGEMPDSLSSLDGQTVEISGFIVPLELDDYIDSVQEFLLVPDPMACIHVPPPPPNQMIYVRMIKAIPLDMDLRGVTIEGRLIIPRPKSNDGEISFEIFGISAKEADIDVDTMYFESLDLY